MSGRRVWGLKCRVKGAGCRVALVKHLHGVLPIDPPISGNLVCDHLEFGFEVWNSVRLRQSQLDFGLGSSHSVTGMHP